MDRDQREKKSDDDLEPRVELVRLHEEGEQGDAGADDDGEDDVERVEQAVARDYDRDDDLGHGEVAAKGPLGAGGAGRRDAAVGGERARWQGHNRRRVVPRAVRAQVLQRRVVELRGPGLRVVRVDPQPLDGEAREVVAGPGDEEFRACRARDDPDDRAPLLSQDLEDHVQRLPVEWLRDGDGEGEGGREGEREWEWGENERGRENVFLGGGGDGERGRGGKIERVSLSPLCYLFALSLALSATFGHLNR